MFDYVIVGAGSAGCVLADRLSRQSDTRVLLVEAGGKDSNPNVRIPKGVAKLFANPSLAWHNPTRPLYPGGKPEIWARGRMLGGSSSLNGMVYNRGNRADYDGLERLGNPGWGWDTMLPIFRAMEDNAFGASPTRGAGGPLHVSAPRDPDPLSEEIVASGAALGLTPVADVNESDEERIGHTMGTIRNGRRWSAADAFLRPALRRPNLTLALHTTVTSVLFEGDKAVGVRGLGKDGTAVEYRARREVILSLGSLGTPKLLQLSGIGPAEVLRGAGVAVRLDRPGVGRGMREHRCLALRYRLRGRAGVNHLLDTKAAQMRTGARYLLTRKGPLATPAYDVLSFVKTRPDLDRPDAQILLAPWSLSALEPGKPVSIETQPGVSACAMVLRPTSEGSVAITTADPNAPLDIDPGYLTSGHDRETAVALLRRMRQLFDCDPLAGRISHETFPGPEVTDEEEVVRAALDGGYCGFHAMGTCAMGPAEDAVVDSRLRVRGVENLRAVDASVLPAMVSGNLNGPVMALAWRAAELIGEGA